MKDKEPKEPSDELDQPNGLGDMRLHKMKKLIELDSYRAEYLGAAVGLIKKNYKGEALSDEELRECLIVLQFVAEFCNVSPVFGLMKSELHSEIERLEGFQSARKRF